MRRGRGGASSANSLDLLLDTICNTFGGILFLAMLVSLLLAQTSRKNDAASDAADPRPAMSAAEIDRLENEIDSLTRRIEGYEQTRASLLTVIDELGDPEADRKTAAMEEAEAARVGAESRRAALLAELVAAQAAAARAKSAEAVSARNAESLKKRAERASTDLVRVEKDREELVAAAMRLMDARRNEAVVNAAGRAPLERESSRSEFGLMLRYGRLYCMKVRRNGVLVVNTEDFLVTATGASPQTMRNVASAKPYAGVDLKVADGRDAKVERVLKDFPANQWYPCLVVHPDSFAEFLVLKTLLVQKGYEYRPLPTDAEVADRGGDGRPQ